jgi:hypothetical protein
LGLKQHCKFRVSAHRMAPTPYIKYVTSHHHIVSFVLLNPMPDLTVVYLALCYG